MNKCVCLMVLFVLVVGAVSQGETVYFLVGEMGEPFHNDSYVLPLSIPSDIIHARHLILHGPEIGGALVVAHIDHWDPNNGINLNRNYRLQGMPAWSWYVTEFDGFADFTMEILDGWPTGVEYGIVCSIPGMIGFWHYTVVAELGTDLEPWYCNLDVDGDVDLGDFAMFAEHWMEPGCGHRYWCGGADLDGSGLVDTYDLAVFAENWLWSN
jgi:hypothetical protein